MGFNRRKMEDQRRQAADKQAASRRATDAQMVEDAERLIGAWNERQAKRPRRSAPRSGQAIGSFGYAARRFVPRTRSIFARSIVIAMRSRSAGSDRSERRARQSWPPGIKGGAGTTGPAAAVYTSLDKIAARAPQIANWLARPAKRSHPSRVHTEQFQLPKMVIRKLRHAQTVPALLWLFVCTNNAEVRIRRARPLRCRRTIQHRIMTAVRSYQHQSSM
jgi:hypothetical protein